jgi:tetratricopeptide (TPR) repeat protein
MIRRILLVGWEAADWRLLHPLIDTGKMPALRSIVESGASGTLFSAQPLVPAALWTSLVTGKRLWQHRVCHQQELDAATRRAVPVSAAQRRARALWEMLADHGKRSLVVGWAATHGARGDHAAIVSNRYAEPTAGPGVKPWPPALPGTYWPRSLAAALDPFRVSPEDIQADLIARYVPDWQKVDQKRDRRLGHLRVYLAADFSHHAAMLHLLSRGDWDFAAIHYPSLGAMSSLFLPYLAPKRDWVPEEEFRLYQHVLPAACILCDRLLQNLMQAAGQETAILVTSVHGINPNPPPSYLRARDRELWRSPQGIFAGAGSGLKADSLLLGASVHDVAPTILAWFGLPMGDDMEGRVLIEAFAQPPEVRRVPSWERIAHAAPAEADPLRDAPLADAEAEAFGREQDWNLARSYLDAARYEQALPVLEKLFRSFPERTEFGQALFHCQLTLKQLQTAGDTLCVLLEGIPPGIWSLLPRIEMLIAQRNAREARARVEELRKLQPAHPEALRRLGMILWRLREWAALGDLARQVIESDENEPMAWLALAEASLRQRKPQAAADAANRAIGLNYLLPQAHLARARALVAQGKWDEAREAMQTVLRLQPNHRAAAAYGRRAGLEIDPRHKG